MVWRALGKSVVCGGKVLREWLYCSSAWNFMQESPDQGSPAPGLAEVDLDQRAGLSSLETFNQRK